MHILVKSGEPAEMSASCIVKTLEGSLEGLEDATFARLLSIVGQCA
jgi:hypothetical protein